MSKPKVGIIILNYRSADDTIRCLKNIAKQSYDNLEIIVVDNCSTDNSVDEIFNFGQSYFYEATVITKTFNVIEQKQCNDIEMVFRRDKLTIIENNTNMGYAAGNNIGIKYAVSAGAEAILIINPDVVILDDDFVNKLEESLFASYDRAIVGPKVLNIDGEPLLLQGEPTLFEEILLPLFKPFGLSKFMGIGLRKEFDAYELIEVKKVHGCCFLIRTSALLAVNFLDESTFLYGEEQILSFQMQSLNMKILYSPSIKCIHNHKKRDPDIYALKELKKSRIYFLKKYKKYNGIQCLLVSLKMDLLITRRYVQLLFSK